MNEGEILYSREKQRYFIKLNGNLRFTNGHELNSLLTVIFGDPGLRDIMIDLSETEYIDSTILGLLAKTANFMIKKFRRRAVILSTNRNINNILENIMLTEVFIVVDSSDYSPESLEQIPDIDNSERKNALLLLDAHKQLMKLGDKNRQTFKGVVELLEKETR